MNGPRKIKGSWVDLTQSCVICNNKTFDPSDTNMPRCYSCIEIITKRYCKIEDIFVDGNFVGEKCRSYKDDTMPDSILCSECIKNHLQYFKKIVKLETLQ